MTNPHGAALTREIVDRRRSWLARVWDFLGIPFRFLIPQHLLPRFGWSTLEEERYRAVLPLIQGELLDVGAGSNQLVRLHGRGTGVDVYDWGGGAVVVPDTSHMPFENATFDTVTLIACLNHIPNRKDVLAECHRVVRPSGRLIITMINPLIGEVGHKIWWHSEDKERGMLPGEVGGMWTKDIVRMCEDAGWRLVRHGRFVYRMNHLYAFEAKNT
jgi:SAM-dependent methyltransferase